MKRHPFRWDALIFGLFFLAVLGQWAVWERDLLTPDALAFVAAAALIVLGVLGIVGTAISARSDRRTAPFTPDTTATEDDPVTTDDLTEIEPTETTSTRGGDPA
ncbi:MAG: hypothetical protein WAL70_06330 [Aeromicrobium sp.]